MTSITRFAAVVTLALASGSALMALGQLPTIQEVSWDKVPWRLRSGTSRSTR